ncbi:S8 family serine peptidase, partial [uncultured Bilophila sp.]|uniref:S8 family serine peptidase n=1 Tax=uncultured Bilophila sp. TaxID=529385 RepID=UPI00280A6B10
MKAQKRLNVYLFALLACFLLAGSVQALTPKDFETQEYRNSTGLWVINAAEAYAKGYTGKGITLGVLDTGVNWNHFEFQGKDITWVPCEGYVYDWVKNNHGSHVAGIMAANRDGTDIPGNMHGVAFDADLLAMGALLDGEHESPMGELIKAVLARPDVKIVNNSWGDSLFYLDKLFKAKDDAERAEHLDGLRDVISGYAADSFLENLAEQDKLMVFAAGNSGHRGPSLPAAFPSFLPDLNNWLSVVALDSTEGRISMANDGKTKLLTDSAVPTYSELAMGAEEYTLAAPGTWINSVDATGGYMEMTGTSMAAPYVSGALGLVQQAFPWMTARQMADTVLSTADRSFKAPETIISLGEDKTLDPNTGKTFTKIEIRLQLVDAADRYWDRNQEEKGIPSEGTPERARLENYLRKYYQENSGMVYGYYGLKDADEFIAAFFATEDNPYEITLSDGSLYATTYGSVWKVPFDQIFGQGIVDAGKAVDGPSQLNANRMSPSDLADEKIQAYTGKVELLYAVDTKGSISAWNNDISQELWHANRHTYIMPEFLQEHPDYLATMEKQTSVGLLKNGEGTLYLTGANSYTGSTVIEGGTLSISQRADHSGGQLTSSDVYVLPDGRLQGNGVIHQDVFNWGIVNPGNSIGTLTAGNYTQHSSGTLMMEFDAAGHTDRLVVNGTADIDGSLALAPVIGYYSAPISFAFTDLVSASVLSGSLPGSSAAPGLGLLSPTLTMSATNNNGVYTVTTSRAADAYSRYAANGNAANAGRALSSAEGVRGDMRNLYAALDFSAPDGRTVHDALSQLSPDAYGNAALASFDMHRMLSDLILPGTLSRTPQKDGEWHAFVQPYAGTFDQPGRSGMGGYDATNVGLIGGAERSTPGGLTVGGHVVFNHQSMTGNTNGKLHGEGLYLGAQGLYAPADWGGWNVFGIGRVGMENWRMKRTVSFTGYDRENSKDWTGVSGSARAGGGYEVDWGTLKAGPFAALDYAFTSRPSLTENDGMGSRLHLDSATFHSLRSSLGVRMGTDENAFGRHATWKAHASAAWNHELLDKAGTAHASFVEVANAG